MHFFDDTLKSIQSNWQERPVSEQRILGVVGVLMVLCIAYFFVIEPVVDYRDKQHTLLSQKKKIHAQSVPLVERIQARTLSASSDDGSAGLARVIDQSLQQYNLSMRDFQRGRDGDARVRFKDVDFPSTIKWLYDIEHNKNIIIDELSISSPQDTHLLLVNLRVKKG